MMHTYEELYKINGQGFYTGAYIELHNIPKAKRYSNEGWSYCCSLGSNKDTINIHTTIGVIKGYVYGEKTWFDTKEERDAYRAQRNVERAEETKRNKMIRAITEHLKSLSTEKLEKIAATL